MPMTSTALTGISVATTIVREATDGIPIVKQMVGVASRIAIIAEIDENRADLHALVDRARKMDAMIESVIADRELDEATLRRLEIIKGVLRDIEALLIKCAKRGRFRRVIGYIFTVPKEVGRLREEFDDRVRELQVAASLETKILARGNSRFIGEFRNIRHSEIDILRRIPPVVSQADDKYTVNCYVATCEGSNDVVIVRDIVFSDPDKDAILRIEAHERILEQLSLLRNRHPTIAYLYGRHYGPGHTRFAVLKAGDIRPLRDLLCRGSPEISVVGRIVAKLAMHGAEWAFSLGGVPMDRIYLNERDEPKIGLLTDLSTVSPDPEHHIRSVAIVLSYILGLSSPSSYKSESQYAPRHSGSGAPHTHFFRTLMDAGFCTSYRETAVRRDNIGTLIPFSPEVRAYLSQAHKSLCNPTWGNLLLLGALVSTPWKGSMLGATYVAASDGEPDNIKDSSFR